jgi:cobalt/nickel transport system permease protein
MHIPDGYLSPQTYLPFYAVFISGIGIAIKKVKRGLSARLIPFLGMASAFSFLIMMFNIPIPGGTSGHAVGSALITLVLGPWTAVISVSITLILQALLFSDGGITTIGANCFNMAMLMPFVAHFVFKAIKGKSTSSGRLSLAAFMAGYLSISITAIVTAFELGIQTIIAVSPQGQPLYAPYPLKIALPVMATEHLLIFGIVEGIITTILFRYFYKNHFDLIEALKS